MSATKPHYLLFCDGSPVSTGISHSECRGRWRFVLENIATGEKIEATDSEASDHLDRTALIAVMRGLEALEQPSRVTLITTSRYVARGLQYGLSEWRENEYCWEHFGSVQPIRNADLWKRVDGALRYHEVQCRWMAQDSPGSHQELEVALAGPTSSSLERERTVEPVRDSKLSQHKRRRLPSASQQITDETVSELEPPIVDPLPAVARILEDTSPSNPLSLDPLPAVERKPARILLPLRWTWGIILAIDSFLISCLRCLFLMDPRRDQFRPRRF